MVEIIKSEDFEKLPFIRKAEYVGRLTEENGYHITKTEFQAFKAAYGEVLFTALLMAETRRLLKGWNSAVRQFKKRFSKTDIFSKIVLVGEWLEQYGSNISKENFERGCLKYGHDLVVVLLIAQLRRREGGWKKAIVFFEGRF